MFSAGGGGGAAAPAAMKNGLSSVSTCGSGSAGAGRANLLGRNGPVDMADDEEETSLALRLPRLLPDADESGGPGGSAWTTCVAGAGAYARIASVMSSSPNWE